MAATLRSEDIYEAALDSDALSRLPELVAQAIGGRSSVISWFHPDGRPEVLNYSYFSREMIKEYMDTFASHDLWADVAFSPKYMNNITVCEVGVSEAQFAKSLIYNEFFRRNADDTFHCVGGAHRTGWGTALIGVHRNPRPGPFEPDETERLSAISSHLRSALTLRGRLAAERRRSGVSQAAWDATSLASVVVRRDGRIMQHNAAADVVFRRADCVMCAKNMLRAVVQVQQARLTRAVRLATMAQDPSGSSLLLQTAENEAYLLSVAPMRHTSGHGLALILFKDPFAPTDVLKRQLQDVWGFTPHEAMVATELAQGRSISEIASRRGVQESTVKTQLKAISSKMGGRGQAELIAKISMLTSTS